MNVQPLPPPTEVPLCMIRADLDQLPDFPPPPGSSLRRFQSGDEVHWRRIHLYAEPWHVITPTLFREQFGTDEQFLQERQFYLCDSTGVPVGTATAWVDDDFLGGRWGRVHWVAVHPEQQGRGWGRVLMSAVCRRLRELGHERAFLRTLASRWSALNLYLRFGFHPLPRDAGEARIWQALAPHLKHPCRVP